LVYRKNKHVSIAAIEKRNTGKRINFAENGKKVLIMKLSCKCGSKRKCCKYRKTCILVAE
jgi:hypothetical protein